MGMFRARGEPHPGKFHPSYKDGLCCSETVNYRLSLSSAFLAGGAGREQTAFPVCSALYHSGHCGKCMGEWDWEGGALDFTPPT